MTETSLSSVSHENRQFAPAPEFSAAAHVPSLAAYEAMHQRALADPAGFWGEVAQELHWFKPWTQVHDGSEAPFHRWFVNGQTNLSYNCLDRHLDTATADQAALIWEGEPGDQRTLTYRDLHREVCRLANGLAALGLQRGDRVALYLPLVPELAIAVLACARLGAVHSVIFGGFSADSIRDRVQDCGARFVLTADGGWRRGKLLPLKSVVDEGIASCPTIEKVVVWRRGAGVDLPVTMHPGRDVWWDEVIRDQPDERPAAAMDAEDLLFLLYTSGTTGKPKGIVHTTGGYMVYTYLTAKLVFDLKPTDVYWCTADIGWITGHSYLVYGPLQNGATVLMYEGAPNWPDPARFWQIIEKYGVTIFYTAPTAIRAFMKWGDAYPERHDLSSLRLLGSVGEPINPEAWMWYHEKIGHGRCPIVDTWWQTETGGIMLSPLPGVTATKPGSATRPFPGIDAAILDEAGNAVPAGYLAIRNPWPGMLRGVYGDPQRFKETYWSRWGGQYYFPGDGARVDEDGYFWIVGRVDDVVNVSGHRIGTAELESIFVEHPAVAESAVIGVPHEIKGQGLVAFVTVREGFAADDQLKTELNALVAKAIGKFALPERIIYSADLPKTRSGKIMRRLLRDIAEGRALGNVTTLADPSVVESLQAQVAEQ